MLTYDDISDELDLILAKKRSRWNMSYPTFDDVEQIVRRHIWIKFDMWDQARPFAQWASQVARSQIINIVRNHYKKLAPPCVDCKLSGIDNLCRFTQSGIKDSECPLYAKWERKKQAGYAIKFASSIEQMNDNGFPVCNPSPENFDMGLSIQAFHERMKAALSEKLYKIYVLFYIENRSDAYVSQILGLKNNEKNSNSKRVPGYKQIHNYRELIFEKAKEVMKDFDVVKI